MEHGYHPRRIQKTGGLVLTVIKIQSRKRLPLYKAHMCLVPFVVVLSLHFLSFILFHFVCGTLTLTHTHMLIYTHTIIILLMLKFYLLLYYLLFLFVCDWALQAVVSLSYSRINVTPCFSNPRKIQRNDCLQCSL